MALAWFVVRNAELTASLTVGSTHAASFALRGEKGGFQIQDKSAGEARE